MIESTNELTPISTLFKTDNSVKKIIKHSLASKFLLICCCIMQNIAKIRGWVYHLEEVIYLVFSKNQHKESDIIQDAACHVSGDDSLQSLRARNTDLVSVKSMTFAPNGDLYIIESDERSVNRVRVVSTDGYISHYAGGRPSCDCRVSTCQCWDPAEEIAAKVRGITTDNSYS